VHPELQHLRFFLIETIRCSGKGEIMMRNFIAGGAIMLMLFTADWANSEVCEIIKGNFEDDGTIDDIKAQEPNGWEPKVPSDKFTASIDASWSTIDRFSLFLASIWFKAFDTDDLAILADNLLLTSYIEQQEVNAVNINGN
jgi:hypothetical protein